MSNFRSTRTVQYSSSSGGPGGHSVTETRTTIGPDGRKTTETTTTGGGGGFSASGNIGFDGVNANIDSRFGQMDINFGGSGPVQARVSKPVEGRYSRGWGSSSKRGDTRARSSGPPMKLEGKTYTEIKQQCLREGRLFEDPDFPAQDSSIFYSKSPPRPFTWKRPKEICANPQFFTGGASRFDVKQGELGDCWLLAAVAGLCQVQNLFARVVPPDQDFENQYAGIFHFQFWQYGEWKDIIVDDRLPTYYDKLVFMHSVESNEFWSPLLEKAYAKLNGSYESLKGGATSEAMEDFTGGVTENYDLSKAPPNLFQIMKRAHEKHSLQSCSIDADPNIVEAELANGLIMGHAYTITCVTTIDIKTSRMKGKIPMVRVRNPWGNEAEWNGPWSDKSPEWKFISEEERKEIGLTFTDDGEFWMSFSDYCKNLQKMEICNLGPDSGGDDKQAKTKWEGTKHDGSWKRRVNAGGCRNYLESFWTNPQYRVNVVDADDDDEDDTGTVLVALMQKGRRKLRQEGADMLTMGYAIYELKEDGQGPLDLRYFKYNASVAKAPAFINMREVCGRHKLKPGNYCIIPSTFEPNQEGDFIVRVYTEKPADAGEMDEETNMSDVQPKTEITEADNHEEQELRGAFKRISGDDMEIDAYELQEILNAAFLKGYKSDSKNTAGREFRFEGFSNDTCRSLVAMMDADRSGKLGFEEFKKLWTDIRHWKSVFKQHDKDRSGNFNSYELRMAFHSIGFSVSNGTFNALVQRYSHRDGKIYFDDFIHVVARMKTMFDIFKEMKQGPNQAVFTLDQFIQTTMYS